MVQLGITFNVYGDRQGPSGSFRSTSSRGSSAATNGSMLERGLRQRITALNMLIDDLYHDQRIVKDGVLPEHVVATAKGFRPQCVGLKPPRGVWCHITGTDLVRDTDGQYYVLEDNLRCPSGVSYVLQNRQLMKQTFPQLFERSAIRPVDDYCSRLLDALQYLMGDQTRSPVGGAPVARHAQLGLLRAFVPGPADGHRSGRRPRPGRFRRLRLHADHQGLRADRRALSPHRRRLPRPAGVPRRLDARRAGADGRLSRGPHRAGQRARAPASPTTRSCTPTCRRSSSTI